ncbi:dopamine D2-like receptor [Orbicella faveolata]|uniref:dopamine D2-like receptor n=1 Tax=Orbicella faveolata TaxID=48498 RepID=UPI0009E215F3|nr:dopamine D2-like receptor [Orbicella faveolata]
MEKPKMNSTSTESNATGAVVLSKVEGIALCSAYILASVFIVVGNLFIVVLFVVNKKLRKKSLFLVISMAFADLMLGILSVPIYVLFIGYSYDLWRVEEALSNKSFFMAHTVTDTVFAQASLISAAAISGERFYAIYWPLKSQIVTTRAYRIVLVAVWTLAIVISSVVIALSHFTSYKHAVFAWTPYALILTFIICAFNFSIWTKFQHGRVASQQPNRALHNKRLTKTLLIASGLALLSWLPLIITSILDVHGFSISLRNNLVVNLVNFSNSFINPIVYVLRIPEFRNALGMCSLRTQTTGKTPATDVRNALTPRRRQLRTLRTHPSHPKVAFEQETADSQLYLTKV